MSDIALITGAAKRTGRALVTGLAQRGWDVIIHCHQSLAEAQLLQCEVEAIGRKAFIYSADLTSLNDIEQMTKGICKQFDHIKLLVNNVGNYPIQPLMATTPHQFQQLLQSNVQAPLILVQQLAHILTDALIINMGCAGVEYPLVNANAPAYQISKSALLSITRTLALELAQNNTRVVMISPGHLSNSIDLPDDSDMHFPLKRPGSIRDILATIDYLLGAGNYVTGTNIDIGGGYKLKL